MSGAGNRARITVTSPAPSGITGSDRKESVANERSRPAPAGRSVLRRVELAGIVLLMLIGGFSLWTVIPLGWLWIGSQLSETQQAELGAYMLVLAGVVCSYFAVGYALAALNRRFSRLTGTAESPRVPLPWHQSMRDERRAHRASVLDVVLVSSALLAILTMAVWFFLLAGSPLPS